MFRFAERVHTITRLHKYNDEQCIRPCEMKNAEFDSGKIYYDDVKMTRLIKKYSWDDI